MKSQGDHFIVITCEERLPKTVVDRQGQKKSNMTGNNEAQATGTDRGGQRRQRRGRHRPADNWLHDIHQRVQRCSRESRGR